MGVVIGAWLVGDILVSLSLLSVIEGLGQAIQKLIFTCIEYSRAFNALRGVHMEVVFLNARSYGTFYLEITTLTQYLRALIS